MTPLPLLDTDTSIVKKEEKERGGNQMVNKRKADQERNQTEGVARTKRTEVVGKTRYRKQREKKSEKVSG